MAEPELPLDPSTQNVIEMPGGITLTGMGGDPEALQETFEQRIEEQQPPAAAVTEPEPAAQPIKRTRGQKRFDELTAERETEKRRADAAEARAKELEARLTPAVVAPVAQTAIQPVVSTLTRPEPTEDEVGTKYQTYSAFVKDLAAWTVEQERTKLFADLDARSTERIEADRTSRTRADYVNNTVFPAGRAAYQDFDAVLKKVDGTLIPPAYQQAILSLPNPEHVMYALASDETKLKAVLGITDGVQLGIHLAQLMPRESVAPPASTAPVVRTTNATPPIQPVGASSRTTNPSVEEAALDSQEAYRRARGLRAVK